ncbi:Eukaryotic translation initiation factor 4B, partial [Coemansia aciculifera]
MSWADDDVVALPSAPMASTGAAPTRSSVADAPDRKDLVGRRFEHEPRAPVDFPTEPPFTANVGNLPHSADEAMLREFFAGTQSVRLIRDRETDRPRGFGYVQFDTLEALKEAVAKDGMEMGGRPLRIGVAEKRAGPAGGGSGGGFEDRTGGASNWRRADALPEQPPQATSPFQSRSSSGFGRTPSSGRGESRELREPREPREPLPPSVAEKTSDWRMHKEPPAAPAVAPAAASAGVEAQSTPPKRAGFGDRFSRSSSGAGADSLDEPRVWRRERRDSDSATPPPPPTHRKEIREYQPPRDRSASREPTRAPRQVTVAEQANTWRAARAPAAAVEVPAEAEAEKPAEVEKP